MSLAYSGVSWYRIRHAYSCGLLIVFYIAFAPAVPVWADGSTTEAGDDSNANDINKGSVVIVESSPPTSSIGGESTKTITIGSNSAKNGIAILIDGDSQTEYAPHTLTLTASDSIEVQGQTGISLGRVDSSDVANLILQGGAAARITGTTRGIFINSKSFLSAGTKDAPLRSLIVKSKDIGLHNASKGEESNIFADTIDITSDQDAALEASDGSQTSLVSTGTATFTTNDGATANSNNGTLFLSGDNNNVDITAEKIAILQKNRNNKYLYAVYLKNGTPAVGGSHLSLQSKESMAIQGNVFLDGVNNTLTLNGKDLSIEGTIVGEEPTPINTSSGAALHAYNGSSVTIGDVTPSGNYTTQTASVTSDGYFGILIGKAGVAPTQKDAYGTFNASVTEMFSISAEKGTGLAVAPQGSTALLKTGSLQISGGEDGVYFYGADKLDIESKDSVEIAGGINGIYAFGQNGERRIDLKTTADTSKISITAGTGNGIENTGAKITVDSAKDISIQSTAGSAISAKKGPAAGETTLQGTKAELATSSSTEATVKVGASSNVSAVVDEISISSGAGGTSLEASGSAATIDIKANSGTISGQIHGGASGVINIAGKDVSSAGGTAFLKERIAASGAGSSMIVEGNLLAESTGTIKLALPGSGSLTGWAEDGGTYSAGSGIHLKMGPNAVWNVRQTTANPNSSLYSLAVDTGSKIDLRDSTPNFSTLTIETLSGTGSTFFVDTDIQADKSDQIFVGTGSGTHKVHVQPTGVEPSREAMDTFIVQEKAGDAAFSLANTGGRVEADTYAAHRTC